MVDVLGIKPEGSGWTGSSQSWGGGAAFGMVTSGREGRSVQSQRPHHVCICTCTGHFCLWTFRELPVPKTWTANNWISVIKTLLQHVKTWDSSVSWKRETWLGSIISPYTAPTKELGSQCPCRCICICAYICICNKIMIVGSLFYSLLWVGPSFTEKGKDEGKTLRNSLLKLPWTLLTHAPTHQKNTL